MSKNKSYQVWTCPLEEDVNTSKNILKSKQFKKMKQAVQYHDNLSIGSHSYWIGRIK